MTFFQKASSRIAPMLIAGALHAAPAIETELPPVTVIGRRPLGKIPDKDTEFRGESLEVSSRETSLPRMLRRASSVTTRATGGEGSTPVFLLRGLDPIQSRGFIEGVPLTDAAYHYSPWELVPLEAVTAADLYAEGTPAAFADDGLGGALDFRLDGWRRGEKGECAPGNISARGGSFRYFKVGGTACARRAAPLTMVGAYVQSDEDFPYFDDRGTPFNTSDDGFLRRRHNHFRRVTVLPSLAMPLSSTQRLSLFSLGSYGEKGVPGPVSRPVRGDFSQWYSLTGVRHGMELGNGARVETRLFWKASGETLGNRDPSFAPLVPNHASSLMVGLRENLSARFMGVSGELALGANWEKFRVGQEGTAAVSRERLRLPIGASLKWLPVEAVELSPAVLVQLSDDTGGARRLILSPRLGLGWRPARLFQIRGAVGSYGRAPSLVELFGSPGGISPSPSLVPETALKAEMGADVEWARPVSVIKAVRLSYTYGWSHGRDLISFVQNSQLTRVATNIGEARIRSHEVALAAEGAAGLSGRAGVTLFDTVNLSDIAAYRGNALPHRPPYQGGLGLAWRRGAWELGYEISVFGPSYWDLANTKRLSAMTTHDARVAWHTGGAGVFSLEIMNLTDVMTAPTFLGAFQTIDNSTGYAGYPAPGRRWYLSWSIGI